MKRSIFALLLFAVGCEPINPGPTGCGTLVDPLLAVTVTDAHLENVQVWQAGLVVGHSEGTASLIVDATDGITRNFATTLTGEHSGLVVDASFDDTFGANIPLGLPPGALN